jgi:hypothetical protein
MEKNGAILWSEIENLRKMIKYDVIGAFSMECTG